MKIGAYETVRLLGKGGMSEVYEAENPRLGSRHAIKLFTYEKDDQEVRERFLVEGRLLAKLNHPRIVRVTDFGTDDATGRPYFVMDLVLDAEGNARSLSDVAPGEADEDMVGRWYDDLREGLSYIHSHGVIHRDLKLQNVLIGPDGHAVLTDFGISKIFDAKGDGKTLVDTVNTIVKMREGRTLVMGSIGYMAPELEMGVAASPQSDWYALGVIVYRLLTGTWCDARTDVLSVLDSYDPVWRRIIPKLLHSNPAGRECVSWTDEKRAQHESDEAKWESRWMREKLRGRFARHLARYLVGVCVVMAVALTALWFKAEGDRKAWDAERRSAPAAAAETSPVSFDELFSIPPEARTDDQYDADNVLVLPSRSELATARIDALVLTHEMFARLRAGSITLEQAASRLERLAEAFSDDAEESFGGWPESYIQCGSDEALQWMLLRAKDRLEAQIEP